MPDTIKIGSNSIKNSAIITALLADDSVNASKLDQSADYDFSLGSVTVATPSADGHAASKSYVDGKISGLSWKDEPARVATTADLSATYNNGSSGVGATLTADSNGAISIDGVALSANDRVVVKDQTTQSENGIFFVSTVGDSGTAFVLTRSTDADTPAKLLQAAIFVRQGNTSSDAGYVVSSEVSTIGSSAITFAQFSGAGQVNSGDGLSKSGNTLSVDLATEAGLEFSSSKLRAKVDGSTIERTSSGLGVADAGISSAKIEAAAVTSAKIATAAVGSSQLDSNAVTSAKLADGAVSTAAKLASGIVEASKIASGAVVEDKLGSGAVTKTKLNSNVVRTNAGLALHPTDNDLMLVTDDTTLFVDTDGSAKIKDSGVTAAKISDGAVVSSKLATGSVSSTKIASGAVGSSQLGADCITEAKIADAAVQKEHLNSNVVRPNSGIALNPTDNDLMLVTDDTTLFVDTDGSAKIKDSGVGTSKLGSGAVTAAKLATNAVVSDKLATSAVTSTKINDGAVTNSKIADAAVSFAKLDFASTSELFTGDNSATGFECANASKSLATGEVQVFKDGLRMVYKASPAGADEYSIANNGTGGVLKVVFGSAPTSGQKIIVDYPA